MPCRQLALQPHAIALHPDRGSKVLWAVSTEYHGISVLSCVPIHEHAGEVGQQYKSKARALLFNLRDANNPQLRGRVLTADIRPDALVVMSSEELASQVQQQLTKRTKQETEH